MQTICMNKRVKYTDEIIIILWKFNNKINEKENDMTYNII